MRALTLLGSLALGAAAVCLALGGAEGRAAGAVLLLAGLSWALGPVGDRGDE